MNQSTANPPGVDALVSRVEVPVEVVARCQRYEDLVHLAAALAVVDHVLLVIEGAGIVAMTRAAAKRVLEQNDYTRQAQLIDQYAALGRPVVYILADDSAVVAVLPSGKAAAA